MARLHLQRGAERLEALLAATEAEDVGVEHLLRDVADDAAAGLRTLSGDVNALAG